MNEDLRQFIQGSFDSVWTLELLLLLSSSPEKSWTVNGLVAELRSSDLVVQRSIATLRAGGLILEGADGSIRFASANGQLSMLVVDLADEYRKRPGAVRRLIVAPQDARLHTFVDAFRIRKPNR